MKSVQLQYPVKTKDNKGQEVEIKFLTPSRLKIKHTKLLPASLLSKAGKEGELKVDTAELIPIFSELTPFLASIFSVSEEVIGEIDYEDVEAVIGALEEIFGENEEIKKK